MRMLEALGKIAVTQLNWAAERLKEVLEAHPKVHEALLLAEKLAARGERTLYKQVFEELRSLAGGEVLSDLKINIYTSDSTIDFVFFKTDSTSTSNKGPTLRVEGKGPVKAKAVTESSKHHSGPENFVLFVLSKRPPSIDRLPADALKAVEDAVRRIGAWIEAFRAWAEEKERAWERDPARRRLESIESAAELE